MATERKPAVGKAPPPVRKRGRPARLSREAIIEQALLLLETRSADELSLGAVAEGLGTSTMSLYNYFANRDALLEAVVDHSLSSLQLPPLGRAWQDDLLRWLWALDQHFERYPVILKTIGWNGRVPPAWMQACAPVVQLLRTLGFAGAELAFAVNWFFASVFGLMMVESTAPQYRRTPSLEGIDALPPEAQGAIFELQSHRHLVEHDRVLEFGFRQSIAGLEKLLPSPPRRSRSK